MGKVKKLKVVLRTFDGTPFVVHRALDALRAFEGLVRNLNLFKQLIIDHCSKSYNPVNPDSYDGVRRKDNQIIES